MMLPSYNECRSDENGFVDAADFHAMAINYAIEREMGLTWEIWTYAEVGTV